ncbi:hypothetical protein [Seonamhaeicola sp.]|uniref:hypothetical protein n=1 Tax=Seonamhaeicola sp. TaxID=1912245 RepID=UPI00262DF5B4|nr:hypothetical protein [Seonamhaeicola sp.]
MKEKVSFEIKKRFLNRTDVYLYGEHFGLAYVLWVDTQKEKTTYHITVNKDKRNMFFGCSVSDFEGTDELIHKLSIPINFNLKDHISWMAGPASFNIEFPYPFQDIDEERLAIIAKIEVEIDIINWNELCSIKAYFNKFELKCREKGIFGSFYKTNTNDHDMVTLSLRIEDTSANIGELLDILLSDFLDINKVIQEEITIENRRNSISRIFNFPSELKEPCEQYLIYFSKFLQDIGIDAETSIKEEARGVLFTVIPKDSEEALSQINSALNIYLSLPEIPDLEKYTTSFDDVGVKQLMSNIHFLKSQLLLSQSMIQLKDATINSLNLTNYQQRVLLEEQSMKPQNEERVLGEIVTIKEYEGKGFKINLPKLFRMIKRKFK